MVLIKKKLTRTRRKAPPKPSAAEIEAAAQAVRDLEALTKKAAEIAAQPWWRKWV